MEDVFAPLKDSPAFQKAFVSFNNPFMGIISRSFGNRYNSEF